MVVGKFYHPLVEPCLFKSWGLKIKKKGRFKNVDDLKKQKIEMWTKKLHELEDELSAIMKRKGEAAREGDLRENAAYQMAIEDADTFRARIRDVKKILTDLGVPPEELEKEEK